MELSAPAGNLEKLRYAWAYGADAAYFGLKDFSLRMKADNFAESDAAAVRGLKESFPGRKLYCALNITFHNSDFDLLSGGMETLSLFPIDGFIIQDMGLICALKKRFPATPLHLSTQANCVNAEAAKFYKSAGFSRIVLGREASLPEIRQIKDAVPDVELEAFVHGAMCIAYSGRCLLSAYLAERSANEGNCAHVCRWDFRAFAEARAAGDVALEERERPGEYLPVFEGEGFTAILSSKDLCMIDHLADLRDAGVDSLKIEGRMKSVYYTALVSRAYRKALDALEGKITREEAAPFIAELYNTPHRAFTTAFYYSRRGADETTPGKTECPVILAGIAGRPLSPEEEAALFAKNPGLRERGGFLRFFQAMNKVCAGTPLEVISPDAASRPLSPESYAFLDPASGAPLDWVSHGHEALIHTDPAVGEGEMFRMNNPL